MPMWSTRFSHPKVMTPPKVEIAEDCYPSELHVVCRHQDVFLAGFLASHQPCSISDLLRLILELDLYNFTFLYFFSPKIVEVDPFALRVAIVGECQESISV